MASAPQTLSKRAPDGTPLWEIKLSLVFYLDYAPGPKRARRVYDIWLQAFGRHIRQFASTSWPGPPQKWTDVRRDDFENRLIHRLRQSVDWGYGFTDGLSEDSYLFMFHGYRPASEPGLASFFRFELPREEGCDALLGLATQVANAVPFVSANAGYVFKPRPTQAAAFDDMYATTRRYWGVEAWNIDESVKWMLHGFKTVTWLTGIGDRLTCKLPGAVEAAAPHAYNLHELAHGVLLQSRPQPEWIDRNRGEEFVSEARLSAALLPLQVQTHGSFGGRRWTEDSSVAWLRRFSHPEDM